MPLLFIKLFLRKRGVKLVSLPYFLRDFPRNQILTLYSTNSANFIVWSPFLLEILDSMRIYLSEFDVISSGINLNFVIKPFPYKTKKGRTKIDIS